jgi:hypothetical protein
MRVARYTLNIERYSGSYVFIESRGTRVAG